MTKSVAEFVVENGTNTPYYHDLKHSAGTSSAAAAVV